MSKLARFNRGSLQLAGFAIAVPCVVTLWAAELGAGQRFLLLGAVVLMAVQRSRWVLANARPGMAPAPGAVEGLATMVAVSAAWGYALTVGLVALVWSLLPGGVLAVIVTGRPRARWRAVGASGVVLALVVMGVVGLLGGMPLVALAEPAAVGTAVVLTVVALEALHVWSAELVVRLEDARRMAGDLAVAEERLRFAADLHDTQGHYLEVIALKGDLVERLVDRDVERSRAEAATVARLARQALAETRGLVLGYRRTSLAREIENAAQMLRAVSVDVRVIGDAAEVPHELQPLFGAMVREGATNVLRHSTASHFECSVAVDGGAVCLRLVNDNPAGNGSAGQLAGGAGLAGIRERFAAVNGEVVAGQRDGCFVLSARVPVQRAGSEP